MRPAPAHLGNDPGHLFDRASRGIDIRAPQLGRQQMPAAEDVQRQVAVAVVVAVEEAPLLMAMQRIVRGIQVQHDLRRWHPVRLQELLHEQRLDRRRPIADLVIRPRLRTAQLQPVQRRLAGHRRAVPPLRLQLAGQHRHHRIVAQRIVVDQILVAQRDAEHPLAHQGAQLMFDQPPIALIHEAGGEAVDQPNRPIGGAKQQGAGVRGHRPAIERGDHGTVLDGCKTEQIRVTVCGHRGLPPVRDKPLLQKAFSQIRSPDAAIV